MKFHLIHYILFSLIFININCLRKEISLNRNMANPISSNDQKCRTPLSEEGVCKSIIDCQVMLELLNASKGNSTIAEYLRSSVCEYIQSTPVVCCPSKTSESGSSVSDLDLSSLPDPPVCGQSQIDDARIVGGRPAHQGAWPWVAALGFRKSYGSGKIFYYCGGALITEKYVMTAAHCNTQPRLNLVQVRLGVLNIHMVTNSQQPVDVNVEKVISHSGYNKVKSKDDIALIKLARNVKFSQYVKPICLPKTKELRSNNFVDYNIYVAGWGTLGFKKPSSKILMEVQLPVLSNEICEKSLESFGIPITPEKICAGYLKGGKDACQGDSGGPMMVPQQNTTYIIGIVSYGYKCAEPGYPGVYTRVSSYLDWIVDNMK